jgi:group I intron endonuclease
MSEKICGIYKITNKVNGKVYIGQSVDIYRRWKQHKKIGQGLNETKYQRNKNDPLYRAINKYGVDNFNFEIIEECDKALLSEREIYWIDLLDSTTSHGNGYNQTLGGDSSNGYTQRRKVYQYDLDGNFVAEYESIKDATEGIGADRDNGLVKNAVGRENKQSGGYQWRYEKYERIAPYVREYKHCKVACYDLQGNLEMTFDSLYDAAEYFDCSRSAIEKNCGGKTVITRKHLFRCYDEIPSLIVDVPKLSPKKKFSKPVKQLKDGIVVAVFDSATIAAKILNNGNPNPNGANYIGKICRKVSKFKSYKGYTWEFLT